MVPRAAILYSGSDFGLEYGSFCHAPRPGPAWGGAVVSLGLFAAASVALGNNLAAMIVLVTILCRCLCLGTGLSAAPCSDTLAGPFDCIFATGARCALCAVVPFMLLIRAFEKAVSGKKGSVLATCITIGELRNSSVAPLQQLSCRLGRQDRGVADVLSIPSRWPRARCPCRHGLQGQRPGRAESYFVYS